MDIHFSTIGMATNQFSLKISSFHGRIAPEEAQLVGYGALMDAFALDVPMPDVLFLVSTKNKNYRTDGWQVLGARYLPKESLYKQLTFALKHEGLNLLLLKKLFEKIPEEKIIALIQTEPTGIYSRKIWFIYEWLLDIKLPIPDIEVGNYVPLLDKKNQFALEKGIKSGRHRVVNNLPGTRNFCPLIRRTDKLEKYIANSFLAEKENYLGGIKKDIMQRASAFLMLKDSKASFTIEGESPKSKRTARWAQAIGQAGMQNLSSVELLRLQQLVIENPRFLEMGYRKKGGFIGEHDRITGEPIPDHISAKWQDLDQLMEGLLSTNDLLTKNHLDAVLCAAIIAFGFVFIHPFEDGNGRIHRYLFHHVLAKKQFSMQGIIFPVSASILNHIKDYRLCLESYSRPLLDFIEWKETRHHNIEVLSNTIDYYRYFDATSQAEFLYECVIDTVQNIIPAEVRYLIKYDEFKQYIEEEFEMPDTMIAMLVRFLEQNNGTLSKRGRTKEFNKLSEIEINNIETKFLEIFSKE